MNSYRKIKKQLLLIVMTLCVVPWMVAQTTYTTKSKKAIQLYTEAQDYYVKNNPTQAISLLDEALLKDKKFLEAYFMKAEIYQQYKQYDKQEVELLKAIAIDSTFYVPSFYNLGVIMYNTGRYDQVKGYMNRFTANNKNRRSQLKPEDWIAKAEFAKITIQNPVAFEPRNLGLAVNSKYDEYWPSISADGEKLIYTVLVPRDTVQFNLGKLPKTSQNFKEDFYASRFSKGEWMLREAVISINTDSNEGAQTLSADGNWMFFTACGRSDSKGSCDLYFSKRTQYGWSTPTNVGSPVNTPFWESQPSFSADGRTLYFVSSRPGGIGGKDIWKASIIGFKQDGTPFFGKAENLGAQINSEDDENSPFIHHDNQTLYFSSDGWQGLGEMDLFFAKRDSAGEWQKPVNLGYPINSARDEIGLVINAAGDKAYFSSDGLGEKSAGKDIYEFMMPQSIRPKPATYVKGRIFDKETNEQLLAELKVNQLSDGELAASCESTSFSGEFLVCLPVGNSYALNVEKQGYLFYSDHFEVNENSDVKNPQILNVYLSKIKVGGAIVLRNVFYENDSYQLMSKSFVELNEVVRLLSKNTDVKIEIGGHTDNVGSADYNLELSKKRAQSVFDFLVSNGINANRISYKGYGFSVPIESNDTELGRAKNRRTELKVL